METKISCIIIDDELPALQLMEKYISQADELHLLGTFKSPVKALEYIAEKKPDLLFCDIQMPGLTGLDLVKQLYGKPMVVFTTAYSEFAAEAFDVEAIDYLKKPFSFERFKRTVSKAKENYNLKYAGQQLSNVEQAENDYIVIKSDHKLIKIYFDEILFLEAFQEYVKIVTNQTRYITFERLKNMENMLPSAKFIRVHRSYIVAKTKVKSMSGNLLEIEEHQIPVSRDLKEKVLRYLFYT